MFAKYKYVSLDGQPMRETFHIYKKPPFVLVLSLQWYHAEIYLLKFYARFSLPKERNMLHISFLLVSRAIPESVAEVAANWRMLFL